MPPIPPEPEPRPKDLAAAIAQEARLLGSLRESLLEQRAGVAHNQRDTIEKSVEAISRGLLTLEEARRRRAALLALVSEGEASTMGELERRLGPAFPPALTEVRGALRDAAQGLAREVAINQHILRKALQAGDAFLQRLFSSATAPSPVYGASERAAGPAGGLLLNRTG